MMNMNGSNNDTIRLQNLKVNIERGKTQKAGAEATLAELQKQEASLKEQVRAQGVEPENLDQTIVELEADIAKGLSEAERLLNPATGYIPAAPVQG